MEPQKPLADAKKTVPHPGVIPTTISPEGAPEGTVTTTVTEPLVEKIPDPVAVATPLDVQVQEPAQTSPAQSGVVLLLNPIT